ncbi:MAG: DUF58 domain-containing protein [Bdellovibrionales bacterium]|nr:DUF58 domain-containing protein [Bdellovibrionales bacterium]
MKFPSQPKRRIYLTERAFIGFSVVHFLLLTSIYWNGLFWISLFLFVGFLFLLLFDYLQIQNWNLESSQITTQRRYFLRQKATVAISVNTLFKSSHGVSVQLLPRPFFNARPKIAKLQQTFISKQYRGRFIIDLLKLGRYGFDTYHVMTNSWVRLFSVQWTIHNNTSFDVFPPHVEMTMQEVWTMLGSHTLSNAKKIRRRQSHSADQFHSIREYRSTDSRRQIDARKTARYGTPMVRVFEADKENHNHIVLDHGRSMVGAIGSSSKIDYYLSAAVTLVEAIVQQGDRYSFTTVSSEARTHLQGAYSAEELLILFQQNLVNATTEETQFGASLIQALNQLKAGTVYLFSDLLKYSTQMQLFRALPFLPMKHRYCFLYLVENEFDLKTQLRSMDPSHLDMKTAKRITYLSYLEEQKRSFSSKVRYENISVAAIDEKHWTGSMKRIYQMLEF